MLRSPPVRTWTPFVALMLAAATARAQIGTPFSPPRLVNSTGATDAVADDFTALRFDMFGRLLMAYRTTDPISGDSDIHFTKSRDQGTTWTNAVPAQVGFASDSADDREPVLTGSLGSILIYASDRDQPAGEHDIYWGAASGEPNVFSNNSVVNSDAFGDTADDREPCAATGLGATVCVWQRDTGNFEEDLRFARKLNINAGWSPVAFLNSNAATDVGRDRHPRIATDGAGTWVVVWQSTENLDNTPQVDEDILFARSTDDGVTWSAPALLNSTGTTDGLAADVFPAIAVDPVSGAWICVWITNNSLGGAIGTDNDLFWSRSTNGGAVWSASAILNADALTDHLGAESEDNVPDIAVDASGHFVVTWQRGNTLSNEVDIRAARLDHPGFLWTDSILVNTNGATDTGDDLVPHIAVDGLGHWITAWGSRDSLGGTIGTDLDVLASRFQIPISSNSGTVLCVGYAENGVPRCPCGNDDQVGSDRGCANSTGFGAWCTLTGTASLATPPTASGFGMPPNSSALYFQGTGVVNFGEGSAFGDGLRCVTGSVVRIGTVTNTIAGTSSVTMPATGLAAGNVRAYQVWYRNAVNFCTSSTFNLSSAFLTTWLP